MKNIAALFFLSAFAAGCASDRPVGLPPDNFGEAVRFNAAAEIVNPTAPMDKAPLTYNGERASLAQQRYLTDTVEAPAETTTSSIPSASSGGNGGGGGGAGAGTGGAAAQ
jgi:hypothetical protein